MSTSLHLQEITPDNFESAVNLRVHPDQEHLVAPVVKSLAEAYVHPGIAWPRLLCDDDEVVGFLMAFFDIDWTGKGDDFRSGLWRLNIADGKQGRGYGRFAVQSVADEIRRRGGTRLTTTWHSGADGPAGFYLALGFRPTGESSGDQTVGTLELG
ncbi:GNAT family N-acetyltransferase [Kitasatospora sp. NPDC101176]|uniref:GNAT family N-acetyltransferase n=1 Tax=Kitasatospora sp. NPDC101176 TaxID=3364099 RepID=UPI0037F98727